MKNKDYSPLKTKGAFHLSDLTGQTIPVALRILLLIKTVQTDQSNFKRYEQRRWVSIKKTFGKILFHYQND